MLTDQTASVNADMATDFETWLRAQARLEGKELSIDAANRRASTVAPRVSMGEPPATCRVSCTWDKQGDSLKHASGQLGPCIWHHSAFLTICMLCSVVVCTAPNPTTAPSSPNGFVDVLIP